MKICELKSEVPFLVAGLCWLQSYLDSLCLLLLLLRLSYITADLFIPLCQHNILCT